MSPQIVILAAGQSSRFFPFNDQHKSLYSVCGQPILFHTLDSIRKTNLKDIIIVHNFSDQDLEMVEDHVKDLNATFVRQEKPLGQGDAILKAREHINQPFFVINANELNFHHHVDQIIAKFDSEQAEIVTLREETDTPQKYGIYELDGDRVIRLVEKPDQAVAPSKWRNIVVYLFDPKVLDTLETIKPSDSHLEEAVTKLAGGQKVFALKATAPGSSIKYPWDLLNIKDMLLNTLEPGISDDAQIAPTAIIDGQVTIAPGAQVHDYAVITGPAYIGRNAVVGRFCQVRDGTVLEEGARVERYCDVRGSLIGPNSHIHSEFIGDSILGSDIRIGAGFITANKRIDRADIQVQVKGELVDTRRHNLGVLIGNRSSLGIRLGTMPGTIIGYDSQVYPGLNIKGVFPENSTIKKSNL